MENVIARALFESFKSWGSKDPTYKKLYNKLNMETFKIITDAFEELDIYKPGMYDFWWTNEHMRYIKTIPNEQCRLVHELMYQFLTRYCRGQLNAKTISKKEESRAYQTRAII